MNHDAPRQREKDGRWDYTSANPRSGTHPIGYCAGWRDPHDWDWLPEAEQGREYERLAPFQDRYHTDGHETAEEACACYKEYLLDVRLSFHRWDHTTESGEPVLPGVLHICDEPSCTEYTSDQASIGGRAWLWYLCPEHLNREVVEKLLTVGESWHS